MCGVGRRLGPGSVERESARSQRNGINRRTRSALYPLAPSARQAGNLQKRLARRRWEWADDGPAPAGGDLTTSWWLEQVVGVELLEWKG